jgi:hypothetical protein
MDWGAVPSSILTVPVAPEAGVVPVVLAPPVVFAGVDVDFALVLL